MRHCSEYSFLSIIKLFASVGKWFQHLKFFREVGI